MTFLPRLRDLEIAGFRVNAGVKRGEPDLVWIDQLRAWMPLALAVQNGFIVEPRHQEAHLNPPPLSAEELLAKARGLQDGPYKTNLLKTLSQQ